MTDRVGGGSGRRATWLDAPGPDTRCTIVGEVAQAHDGSLGMAHAFIDAIADAGADAVKFQTHIAAEESTPAEPWRRRFSRQDATRFDYWRRMEFTPEQWAGLRRHCAARGVLFLSTPFSMRALELLEAVGVAGWKVASGEVTNRPVLRAMAETGWPVMLSTGMSDLAEIDAAVDFLKGFGVPLAVLQCATRYPCPPEAVGLNNLPLFRARYGTAVGLSDHSATIYPGLAAVQLGAQVVEVHVTLSRRMFGPDVTASLTPEELAQLTEGARFVEAMLAHPVDKARLPEDVAGVRGIFMKSVTARADLPAGTVLAADHLCLKKPGTGIPPTELERVVGRRLVRGVARDRALTWDDLEAAAE
jgi:N,N'-diacetyllegionaminate synthase